ncbi:MAG: phosphoserine phosphatase SerB [Alphaproteobacteria bacterium]|nr:phosphoserine phosphatase SerB [Alphaproteobacteria bacterium]
MSYVLTLVASDNAPPLTEEHFNDVEKIAAHYNLNFTSRIIWLDQSKAGEVCISSNAQYALVEHLRNIFKKDRVDFFITKNGNRQKKLLLADMDSTIVTSETLDELADFAGIKEKISQITASAMNGEIDFHEAVRERVSLLKGLKTDAIQSTLDATELSSGARTFVSTMRKNSATCILVSGGFTIFTENIAERCKFHHNHGNTLSIDGEALSGTVEGPILDKHSKVDFLQRYTQDLGINMDQCLTIGDGANDLPMLKMAGLGIGYHPKEPVKKEMVNCILYGDLTAALYAQGFSSQNFEHV